MHEDETDKDLHQQAPPTIHDDQEKKENEAIHSDSEEDAMYSVGSTPAGTPIKLPKGHVISEDECQLLVEMESQNEVLQIKDSYEKKINDLELTQTTLEDKIQSLEKQLTTCQEDFEKTVVEVKKNLTCKLDQATKQADTAKKDLESMVIKYAMSEKQVIEAKKTRETSEQKVKEVLKDKDSLQGRIKALTTDKTSLTTALDRKIVEHANSIKEIERLTNDLKGKDVILKQTQQKLNHSQNLHDELKEQILNLNNVMEVLKGELEACKDKTAQSMEREQQVEQDVARVHELELKLNDELAGVEAAKQEMESIKQNFQDQLNQERQLVSDKEALLEAQIKTTQDIEKRLQEMTSHNQDLQTEIEACKHKDEELSDLNDRLKDKITSCQEEIAKLSQENQDLKNQIQVIRSEKDMCNGLKESLQQQLDSLQKEFEHKNQEGQASLAEKTNTIAHLKAKVDELENDKRILSKKHANSLREMTKELQRKKQEISLMTSSSMESSSLPIPVTDGLSATSRTSSSSSLDVLAQSTSNNESPESDKKKTPSSSNGTSSESSGKINEEVPSLDSSSLPELSRQSLVERILKLQRMLNKRSEKVDFLEDHNHQLVEELKKKTRLIQFYLLREESGALTTTEMDKNKVSKLTLTIITNTFLSERTT